MHKKCVDICDDVCIVSRPMVLNFCPPLAVTQNTAVGTKESHPRQCEHLGLRMTQVWSYLRVQFRICPRHLGTRQTSRA